MNAISIGPECCCCFVAFKSLFSRNAACPLVIPFLLVFPPPPLTNVQFSIGENGSTQRGWKGTIQL
jgi:hypothetical protein